jgi:hypothetical protein
MARPAQQEVIRRKVREYLAIAEAHSPEEYPLDVRSVAAKLAVSPTTLYKYRLNQEINAAEQRQRENAKLSGKLIERRAYSDRIYEMTMELDREREKNKKLVARIVMIEANAARLGIDPEELYRELPKPIRLTPHARGRGKGKWTR